MQSQARTVWIIVSLAISMTIGSAVLMLLDQNGPSAGAFSLSSYVRLDSVDKVMSISSSAKAFNWNRIEVCYSHTATGNLEKLATLAGMTSSSDVNYHFVVCNGLDEQDGLIQNTQRWSYQRSAVPDPEWYGTAATIRICVIADGIKTLPTEIQIKRTAALVDRLSRKFNVETNQISYPDNWQL